MADKPTLFSGPMVRALLAGTKTQTRRAISGVPMFSADYDGQWRPHVLRPGGAMPSEWSWWEGPSHGPSMYHHQKLPVSKGDRLWVRESLKIESTDQGVRYPTYTADGAKLWPLSEWTRDRNAVPSIHMWRWASRLTLTVTDVRVERLQECSEDDALSEGIVRHGRFYGLEDGDWDDAALSARAAYAYLWDSINGDGAWATNPWVAAYTFTVEHGNIDALARAA